MYELQAKLDFCFTREFGSYIPALENEIGSGSFMTSDTSAVIQMIADEGGFDLARVEFGKSVQKISHNGQQFTLHLADEENVTVDVVICTAAISQYTSGRISIDFLPKEHLVLGLNNEVL